MPPSTATTGNHDTPPLALTPAMMGRLKPAKIFKNAVEQQPPSPGNQSGRPQNTVTRHITGISFDDRGDQVVTASEDETFRLQIKTLHSKKYGVDLPRFTHKNTAIVHASTKEDDTVRYHSLHDNKYLQYFKGHKARVVSLEVSPIDDGFMSGSMDKTVRLWDLRSPTCRGLLNLPASPIVAYDASGLVFAVAVNRYQRILLYDQANFDKAPFLVITLDDPTLALISFPPRAIYMTSLTFSSNGKYLLVGCSGDAHYIVDAFEGHLLAKLEGHVGLERRRLGTPIGIEPQRGISGEEVSWTPDSRFVISGSLDGKVVLWDVQKLPEKQGDVDPKSPPLRLQPLVNLEGHPGPSRCARFNPRFAMMVTAGAELAFWLPDQSGDPDDIAKELLKKRAGPGKLTALDSNSIRGGRGKLGASASEVVQHFSSPPSLDAFAGKMRLQTLLGSLLGFVALLAAAESTEPVVLAIASFPEDNAFGQIVNGERNKIFLTIENHSDQNITIKNIAGSFYNPDTNALVKNTSALAYDVLLLEGAKMQLPYTFYSEFKPGDLKLNIWLDHVADGETYRVTAYDSVVTVVEPEASWLDFKMLSTYLVVSVLLGGLGYYTYLTFVPQPKKRKTRATTTVSAPVGTVTATGAGGYQEEWIPEHHLKKSKVRKTKSGVATSGDETSGTEMSGAESRKGKGRK
ncbi:hypothetical protein POSPLADRAFT_1076275 [Postia placenta MAD-698-R-SB12]|uniref:Signal sequence receptor subunit alpha n=1 Tax=Postia placenta MAD-698-R-SB12 TaxID=670580 RepID=A0A1X6MNB2_9APHY|nr:hypothetical protein POSPLADRAFT_1076275 [Postia placenta MAD-698-R-SB12]OSX57840.1 hypothetical protein POSPLADRAFT_1076275 [Postia placenta MAD-698-R-SB12]